MTAVETLGQRTKPRRPLYLAPPTDTLALTEEVEALLDRHWPAAPRDLLALAAEGRRDLATMLLYRACHRGANGAFLHAAARLPAGLAPLATPIRLLIVPGFLFAEHPELALDGSLIQGVAERLGAEAVVLPVESRGVSATNARHLADHLAGPFDRPTWLLTISKGASDTRAAMQLLGGWPRALSGWLDLSGIFSGTPIADWWTDETVKRWLMRALFGTVNLPFGTLMEMRRDAAIWRDPVVPPARERLVHVLGFPPPDRVEPRMARNYRRLYREHGPNDGFTPLAAAFDYPGRLFPVWGADHLMRLPDVAQLVYRLVHLAAAVEAGRIPPSNGKADR